MTTMASGSVVRSAGFTLLELVVVLVIVSIVSAFSFRFIGGAMKSYSDTEQRFLLVEAVDPAMNRMRNDVAQSLPYSIRVTPNGSAVEFAQVVEGGFYRTEAPDPTPGEPPAARPLAPLEFSPTVMSSEFTLLGRLKAIDNDAVSNPNGLYFDLLGPPYAVSVGHFGEINSLGEPLPGFNIYSPAGSTEPVSGVRMDVVSPAGVLLQTPQDSTGSDQGPDSFVQLPASHVFPNQSPGRRLYVINGFISYICTDGNLFRRQRGLVVGRTAVQDIDVSGAALLATGIASCRFEYDRGSFFQAPILTVEMRLTHSGGQGELVVFRQLAVEASP